MYNEYEITFQYDNKSDELKTATAKGEKDGKFRSKIFHLLSCMCQRQDLK